MNHSKQIRYWCSGALITCSLLLLTGCGGGDRPALAKLSGIVTLEGVPVSGATISLVPVDGGRVGTAVTDDSGRYTISTYPGDANDGAIVGKHKVGILKIGGEGALMLTQEETTDINNELAPASGEVDGVTEAAKEPKIEYLVPKRYVNPNESNLTVEVPAAGNENANFELTL